MNQTPSSPWQELEILSMKVLSWVMNETLAWVMNNSTLNPQSLLPPAKACPSFVVSSSSPPLLGKHCFQLNATDLKVTQHCSKTETDKAFTVYCMCIWTFM
ncbi:hypothetical protein GOODEAATRI_013913 [Goodea atripinnis]|uniref:Uncharacterized protein n=1 Tax=Goodea atripinnis TaxID=208336 RepID=A0ABV0NK19_9TELE